MNTALVVNQALAKMSCQPSTAGVDTAFRANSSQPPRRALPTSIALLPSPSTHAHLARNLEKFLSAANPARSFVKNLTKAQSFLHKKSDRSPGGRGGRRSDADR